MSHLLDEIIRDRWDWLKHQATGSAPVIKKTIHDLEDAGRTEDRIRQDYTGRYPLELLQNAHDASADADHVGAVHFVVTRSALLVANEGVPFNHDRISSLIRLGSSEKLLSRNRRKVIGYKGVGFTAVFEISDRPQIISQGIVFGFDRRRAKQAVAKKLGRVPAQVPARYFPFLLDPRDWTEDADEVNRLRELGAVTIVRLPLRSGNNRDDVMKHVTSCCPPEVLLFMPSVDRIVISDSADSVCWRRRPGRKIGLGKLVTLEGPTGAERCWVLHQSTVRVPTALIQRLDDRLWSGVSKLNVDVALPWKRGKGIDEAASTQNIHVYFPTDDRLGRAVLVHGDFYVESSRRHIETNGPGGEISRLVGTKATQLVGEFAESLSAHGKSLLKCLALQAEASGFGIPFGEMLKKTLAEKRIARPADGSNPQQPRKIKILCSALEIAAEKNFVRLLSTKLRKRILRPEDGEGLAGDLLKWLEADECDAIELSVHIDLPQSEIEYHKALQLIRDWLQNLDGVQKFQVIQKLKTLRIVMDTEGRWRRPDEVVLLPKGSPILPATLRKDQLSLPKSRSALELIELLEVKSLTPVAALGIVLDALTERTFGTNETQARQAWLFVRKMWEADRSTVRARNGSLGVVPVPTRKLGGKKTDWRRADSVYFSKEWIGDKTLEELYGAFAESEFLAESPSKNRHHLLDFYKTLGVASSPRMKLFDLYASRRSSSELAGFSDWHTRLENEGAFHCPDGHDYTPRELKFEVMDRLDRILQAGTRVRSSAVARSLGKSGNPFGKPARTRCTHSWHRGKNVKDAIGYQQWLLQTCSWVPVINDPTGASFRPPAECWINIPRKNRKWLRVPQPLLADELLRSFGPVDSDRPKTDSLEKALADLSANSPDLSTAPEEIRRTAQWIVHHLDRALRRNPSERTAPPLPAQKQGTVLWSSDPLIPDLPEFFKMDQLVLLPPGDWRGLQKAYHLRRVSDVLSIEVRRGKVYPAKQFLTRTTRAQLAAVLERQGTDFGHLIFRLARLKEFPTTPLEIEARFDGGELKAAAPFYLRRKLDRLNRITGCDLFVNFETFQVSSTCWIDLARALAHYLDEPDADSEIALFLSQHEAVLEGRHISQEAVTTAYHALGRRGLEGEDDSQPPVSTTETEELNTDVEPLSEDREATNIRQKVVTALTERFEADDETAAEKAEASPPSGNEDGNKGANTSIEDLELPPLESVTPQLLESSNSWSPPPRQAGSGSGDRIMRRVRHSDSRDRAIGQRGEEIVFREETDRVKKLGYPESRVIWVSKSDPLADHDILSVDDDGQDLWIEVKSTTGKDGRFQWSRAEFEKALSERDRYILFRVYAAQSLMPKIKPFRDPIALFLSHSMRLDIAGLFGEVEPLDQLALIPGDHAL